VPRLERTLRTGDGLAVVVGIMVGSGIFRTPGTVAALLGRPGLMFGGEGRISHDGTTGPDSLGVGYATDREDL
jgi:hypothetical protein